MEFDLQAVRNPSITDRLKAELHALPTLNRLKLKAELPTAAGPFGW
jgi:hypothetical protein